MTEESEFMKKLRSQMGWSDQLPEVKSMTTRELMQERMAWTTSERMAEVAKELSRREVQKIDN